MESVEFHFPQNLFGLVLAGGYFQFFQVHLPCPSLKVNKLCLRFMGSPSMKLQTNNVEIYVTREQIIPLLASLLFLVLNFTSARLK